MKILDGKALALEIQKDLKAKIQPLVGKKPHLAFIIIGENSASWTYVKAKQKACANVGIQSTLIELPATTSQEILLKHIHHLNVNPEVDGILVQLPLPLHIHDEAIMESINPQKDVDGFHPINMGKILLGQTTGFAACTPKGIVQLISHYEVPVSGKHVVILGRSNIVGKPLGAMLVQKKEHCDATVTIAHSRSDNISAIIKSADILIAAMGKPLFIKSHMIKEGACVIDVGINKLPDLGLVGDVDFKNVAPLCSYITPVPGGVGPMTIACLLQNTFQSFLRRNDH